MILVWGARSDPATAAVLSALDRRDHAWVFLDQEDEPPDSWTFDFVPERGGYVEDLDLDTVGAAFIRPHGGPRPAGRGVREAADWSSGRHLISWLETTSALVVNRLSCQASNMSKLLQLELIRAHGFATPPSLATTDPADARAFVACHGAVIYKSLSGVRSVVRKLPESELDRLRDVASCPTLFQAFVPGTDYRVHVVGDRVFGTLIRSSADDYRYDRTSERTAIDLPRDIADRCAALTAGLGLAVSGIDLRRTRAGEWVCFEANPSPVFTYFDRDGAIASAIADLLASVDQGRNRPRDLPRSTRSRRSERME